MDRPRRAASKITDFRKYHLSGNLDCKIQGLVETPKQLKEQLEEEKEASRRIQEDVEHLRI